MEASDAVAESSAYFNAAARSRSTTCEGVCPFVPLHWLCVSSIGRAYTPRHCSHRQSAAPGPHARAPPACSVALPLTTLPHIYAHTLRSQQNPPDGPPVSVLGCPLTLPSPTKPNTFDEVRSQTG